MELNWNFQCCLICLLFLVVCFEPSYQISNIHRARKERAFTSTSENNANIDISKNLKKQVHDENIKEIELDNLFSNTSYSTSDYTRTEAALYAMISAGLVGFSGVLPLLVLPSLKDGDKLKEGAGAIKLKRLLSFAVGGLLGDVFLHLLPESWEHLEKTSENGLLDNWNETANGLWILFGLISFCLLEKLLPDDIVNNIDESEKIVKAKYFECNGQNMNENNNNIVTKLPSEEKHFQNGYILKNHEKVNRCLVQEQKPPNRIKTSGYLNLLANCIDNFTHGLAVGGSYLVSQRMGLLTTLAILLHEIPHEVGDFAILMRAGFTRWQAAKLQVVTASGGLLGALFAILAESAKSAGDRVAWILPFTSGGFIYVALCTVVPDILKETSPRESIIQLFFILMAIGVMHAVSFIG